MISIRTHICTNQIFLSNTNVMLIFPYFSISSTMMAYTAIWIQVQQQCTIHTVATDRPDYPAYRHTIHHTWVMLPLPHQSACMAIMAHLVMYHQLLIIWVLYNQMYINVIKKLFMGKFHLRTTSSSSLLCHKSYKISSPSSNFFQKTSTWHKCGQFLINMHHTHPSSVQIAPLLLNYHTY